MKRSSISPLVSIILVTWNNEFHLLRCLDNIAMQAFEDFEIILVDNGSTDDWVSGLPGKYPLLDFSIEKLSTNLGFAVANNIGARLARGKWIALLNVDAFPAPDWLENLLRAATQNPEYTAFSSRQIQYNDPHLLDGAGDAYHVSGLAWRNGYNLPADKHGLEQREIFSPCGAAALYLRDEFLQLGGFDEDYFSYFEDVDLGFRIRLGGGKCLYVPGAVVHHVGSGSTGKRSDFSVYYGYRNLIWTFVKNMPPPLLWLFLPLHIATMLFFTAYLTLRRQGRVIWKAAFDAVGGLPKAIEKRRAIQKNRKIRSSDLLRVMSTGILEPWREFMERNKNT